MDTSQRINLDSSPLYEHIYAASESMGSVQQRVTNPGQSSRSKSKQRSEEATGTNNDAIGSSSNLDTLIGMVSLSADKDILPISRIFVASALGEGFPNVVIKKGRPRKHTLGWLSCPSYHSSSQIDVTENIDDSHCQAFQILKFDSIQI